MLPRVPPAIVDVPVQEVGSTPSSSRVVPIDVLSGMLGTVDPIVMVIINVVPDLVNLVVGT